MRLLRHSDQSRNDLVGHCIPTSRDIPLLILMREWCQSTIDVVAHVAQRDSFLTFARNIDRIIGPTTSSLSPSPSALVVDGMSLAVADRFVNKLIRDVVSSMQFYVRRVPSASAKPSMLTIDECRLASRMIIQEQMNDDELDAEDNEDDDDDDDDDDELDDDDFDDDDDDDDDDDTAAALYHVHRTNPA